VIARSTLAFLVIVAIIAANQAVLRVAALRRTPWIFWTLQALNLAIACWFLLAGVPGFDDWPLVSWILALLLILRIIQNNLIRTRYLRQAREEEIREAKKAEARRISEALAAQEAAQRPGSDPPGPEERTEP
jgi:type VI protein secretion system component VasK